MKRIIFVLLMGCHINDYQLSLRMCNIDLHVQRLYSLHRKVIQVVFRLQQCVMYEAIDGYAVKNKPKQNTSICSPMPSQLYKL